MAPQAHFVLADISGFTAYLAGVELEHANAILRDLLELLVARLAPPLTLAGVDGDAVFAYAPVERLARGETLVELVEAAYSGFRERLESIARRTTCTCRACRAVPQLDLKFMVHAGEYLPQRVDGREALLGLAVDVLRQRWLKVPVSAATGWRGYALFTADSLARLGVAPASLGGHRQAVAAGPAGDIVTYSLDLQARYAQRLAARRTFVSAEAADLVMVQDLPAEPAVVWQWLNDPARRSRWMTGRHWHGGARPGGRTDVGARNHCEHGVGTATETVLDWRPFDYYTVEITPQTSGLTVHLTYQLEPLAHGQGTRLHNHIRLQRPLPRFLARSLCRLAGQPLVRADLARLARLLAAEAAPATTASHAG